MAAMNFPTSPTIGNTYTTPTGKWLCTDVWVGGAVWESVPDYSIPFVFKIALSDETTEITTGTKRTFRWPIPNSTLVAVRAELNTVSSSGAPQFDVKEAGTSIFSTKVTIDASEKTSLTAATPAVISDASIADDEEVTCIIDTAGTGAKGAKLTFIGYYEP